MQTADQEDNVNAPPRSRRSRATDVETATSTTRKSTFLTPFPKASAFFHKTPKSKDDQTHYQAQIKKLEAELEMSKIELASRSRLIVQLREEKNRSCGEERVPSRRRGSVAYEDNRENDALQRGIFKLKEQKARLDEDVAALRNTIDKLNNDKSVTEQEIEDLRNHHNELNGDVKCQTESQAELTGKLASSQREFDRLELLVEKRSTELDGINKEIADMKTTSRRLTTEIENLKKELEQLKKQKSDLESEIHKLETTKTDLDSSSSKTKAELEKSRTEEQQLKKTLDELRAEVAGNEAKKKTVEESLNAYQAQMNALKNEVEAVAARIEELELVGDAEDTIRGSRDELRKIRSAEDGERSILDSIPLIGRMIQNRTKIMCEHINRLSTRQQTLKSETDTMQQKLEDLKSQHQILSRQHSDANQRARTQKEDEERRIKDLRHQVESEQAKLSKLQAECSKEDSKLEELKERVTACLGEYERARADLEEVHRAKHPMLGGEDYGPRGMQGMRPAHHGYGLVEDTYGHSRAKQGWPKVPSEYLQRTSEWGPASTGKQQTTGSGGFTGGGPSPSSNSFPSMGPINSQMANEQSSPNDGGAAFTGGPAGPYGPPNSHHHHHHPEMSYTPAAQRRPSDL